MTDEARSWTDLDTAHAAIVELLYMELRASYVAALAAGADPAELRGVLTRRIDALIDMREDHLGRS